MKTATNQVTGGSAAQELTPAMSKFIERGRSQGVGQAEIMVRGILATHGYD